MCNVLHPSCLLSPFFKDEGKGRIFINNEGNCIKNMVTKKELAKLKPYKGDGLYFFITVIK